MITALVTGIGGTRSIAVLHALRAGKDKVRVIGTDANYFNAGSFMCEVAYTLPFVSDPSYLPELERIIQLEGVSIVFATVEKEVSFLAAHKRELEELGVAVIVPEPEILEVCFSKYETQEFLQKNDFTYIPTVYCDDRATVKQFADEQGLPLIRKPISGYGSRGVSIVRTAAELEQVEPDKSYVLQKYIENDDSESYYNTVLNEYTAEVFVNQDFSIAGGIILKRALHAGETIAGYRVEDDATLEYLSGIAAKLKIKGPCNFQYRKHEGNVYVFEINPLFSGTTSIRASLGFNNVLLAVSSFVEGKHGTITQSELKSQYFIRYLQENFIDLQDMETLKSQKKISRE